MWHHMLTSGRFLSGILLMSFTLDYARPTFYYIAFGDRNTSLYADCGRLEPPVGSRGRTPGCESQIC